MRLLRVSRCFDTGTARKADETLLLKYLGDSPTLRIIDFFLDNPLSDYSKNEIAKNLTMSRATFFKYWKELEQSGALAVTRKIGRATLYKLDRAAWRYSATRSTVGLASISRVLHKSIT